MTEVAKTGTYTVQKGDSLWKISHATGQSVDSLRQLNGLKCDTIQIGQELIVKGTPASKPVSNAVTKAVSKPLFKTSSSTEAFKLSFETNNTSPKTSSGIMTQAKYEANEPAEVTMLKSHLKKAEGKVISAYIAPEGKATIGHGHLLINKPSFLLAIEKQQLSPKAKNQKVSEALKNPENAAALRASLQKDLSEAIKLTGIKDVPATVSQDLHLTDAQINLLLNSDLKKAHDAMERDIGKATLAKRTNEQKLVAIDLYYNVGDLKKKAPAFLKHFKNGDMKKAQSQLDFFRSDGKFHLGLIRRNYERMQLLNGNQGISKEAEAKLLYAYNKYCTQQGKQIACNFSQAEKKIKV